MKPIAIAALIALSLIAQDRFDHKVRNDFFAGFSGDREALARGMSVTGAVIEQNPNHAEALVWNGAGLLFQVGEIMQKGDREKGIAQYTKAMAQMDKAVELAPKSVGVRIPRGAVLMQASMGMPPQMANAILEKALGDYLATYEMQKDTLGTVGEHPKGELLFGIANSYRRLGDEAKAEEWFRKVAALMPGTNYAKRADVWLTTKTLTPGQQRCVGCHVK